VAHKTPGRIRMKLPAGKGDPELLEKVKATFSAIPGIEKVKVNPDTGSILLTWDADAHHHDDVHCQICEHIAQHHGEVEGGPPSKDEALPTNEIDDMAQKIQQEAEFLAEHSQSARVVVDLFKELDKQIKVSTKNTVDLKIVLAAGVVGFTLLEVGATAATPIWFTVAVFSLNHMVAMQHAAPARPAPAPKA
jgi:hypothetical protein